MSDATWEKARAGTPTRTSFNPDRWKYLISAGLILAAVVYLVISGTMAGAQYFLTVEKVVNDPTYAGQTVRLSGAVVGDTIQYDTANLIIDFEIANIPETYEDLAQTLYQAANDPNALRMPVHIEGQVKPDLLQHEAQAILSGHLGDDGVFYANELLLKCPSRFEESGAEQVIGQE